MSNGNVFISGASRGIGNSIAYHFAENDYVVVGLSLIHISEPTRR